MPVENPLIDPMLELLDDLERYADAAIHGERWPLARTGGREPIPRIVRRLVFERDGGCCLACGTTLTLRTAQLDHIVPWSAGGPDTSGNLRVLCKSCNVRRSNYRGGLDDHAAQRPPVTLVCILCVHIDGHGDEMHEPYEVTPGLVAAYCGFCGTVSQTMPGELC